MCSLVMSPFSRDFIKTEVDQLKYQQCLTYFPALVRIKLHQYNIFLYFQNNVHSIII